MTNHKEGKIDEETVVPIGWVWKAIAVAASILLLIVPAVAYAVSLQVKVEYTAKAVELIPKMQQDIATLLERTNPSKQASKETTIGPAFSNQTSSRFVASDK